jgi:hypothetical protein
LIGANQEKISDKFWIGDSGAKSHITCSETGLLMLNQVTTVLLWGVEEA